MSTILKLALVGCGAIARFHLDGIKSHATNIEVTTLVDLDLAKAQAYADETGGQAFTSLDEALEKGDFDAVDIMLPHDLHEKIALQCFAAGKHVLLENPIAPALDACDRILSAAKEAPGVFMVAENSQYWPEIVEAKQQIEAGAIGEIITARAAFVYAFRNYGDPETLLACSLALSAGLIVLRAGTGLAFAREYAREAIQAAREEEA